MTRVLDRDRSGREILWECGMCGQPFTRGWGDFCNKCIRDEDRFQKLVQAIMRTPAQRGEGAISHLKGNR